MSAHRTTILAAVLLAVAGSAAEAATRYVATTGSDSGNSCTNADQPCRTIRRGISVMSGGDTLIIGDGTYTEAISDMPSGSPGAYTTIRAANDWGVLIDGSGFPNDYRSGINVQSRSYVLIRGFRVRMNQSSDNNGPISIPYSHHVKIQRCSGSHAPTSGNADTISIGPMSSYVLVEECFAFGGARYQFNVYQSDHVIVRRSVARLDHWTGNLQCAGFTNYDSLNTVWQNNIVLDSDTDNCSGRLYGAFWNENKTDYQPDTSQILQGNIILNVDPYYAADLDWGISGTRVIEDMIIWGTSAGYYGDDGPGVAPSIRATRMTIGDISGTYNGPNTGAAYGTGFSVYGNLDNTLTHSVLSGMSSLGVADYTNSDYNVFFGNGKNYGGNRKAVPGPNDRAVENGNAIDPRAGSLLYLPRIEPGSPLKSAGQGGGQIGAEIMFKRGVTGTLRDEPGWDTLTDEPLWPFPNEDRIRADMASYTGPGATGARGFATGTSIDGSPQTLTKYVWEYLGNEIPSDVYGLHVSMGVLPPAVIGQPYSVVASAGGGTPPYTWSVGAGLPPGLSLSVGGLLVGLPTETGSYSFSVTVTDAQAAVATKILAIVVDPPPMPDAGPGPADAALPPDARPVDARPVDARPTDARPVDARPTTDAGVPPDAPVGSPDAAPQIDAAIDAATPPMDANGGTPDALVLGSDGGVLGLAPEAISGGCGCQAGSRPGNPAMLLLLVGFLVVLRASRRS